MENQAIRRALAWPLAEFLAAVLAIFWAAVPAAGAEARLNRLSISLIEITGGSGSQAWRLRYGTHSSFYQPQLVPAQGDRAWFVHEGWLRLIDTRKGLVIGRWRFPYRIVRLIPEGTKVQVKVEEIGREGQVLGRTLTFDPSAPATPNWPPYSFKQYRLPQTEAQVAWPAIDITGTPALNKVPADQAKKLLPGLEEAVRRDPLTPWLRLSLGKLLWDIGDPRAAKVLEEAIRVPTSDFTELLPISAWLDELGERELARAAFDRGYRDFWARGNDPRLLVEFWGRLLIYSPRGAAWGDPLTEQGRELVERVYKLAPGAEWAEQVWQFYADYLKKNGRAEEARLWRTRADEVSKNSLFPLEPALVPVLDNAFRAVWASILAGVIYILVLFARYQPQRRLDLAKRRQAVEQPPGSSLLSFQRWTRGEQVGFLLLVIAAWVFGFLRVSPSTGNFWRALFAVYFAFLAALLYVLIHFIRHRLRKRDDLEGHEPGTGAQTFSWLDFRRWGLIKRIGFIAAVIGGWIVGLMTITPESSPIPDALMAILAAIAAALLYLFVVYMLDWPRRRRAEAAAKLAPGFSWFNMVYWSTRERLAFCGIVLTAWFALGLGQGALEVIVRLYSAPSKMGNLGGPENISYLENRLPASKARDFFLALANQQDGESEKAERLYRNLPEFAESWNNLGVLLKNSGKDQEARQAFEKALQLDPKLAEAALNLGRPPQSLWTELHQKYLPGQPMLAPPRRDLAILALSGVSLRRLHLQALAGPFTGVGIEGWDVRSLTPETAKAVFTAVWVFAIALLFLIPSREVTQPAGKLQWIWEFLFPGAHPAWGFFGGLALAAWCSLVMQAILLFQLGTPYMFVYESTPMLSGRFGVPIEQSDVWRLVNPSWVWLYLAPAALFAANLALVLRSRKS